MVNDGYAAMKQLQLQHCAASLRRRGFGTEVFEDRAAVLAWLKENIPEGASIGVGGSVTLDETGVIAWLTGNSSYRFLDRYHTDDRDRIFHESLVADYYLMSSNAITLDGSLYNVDGNGNRLAALIYGPKKVFVIAGWNKIVRDDAAARERVEMIAAPANTQRLHKATPCTKTGMCMHCDTADTICNEEVFTRRPRPLGRISVLLVKEDLGY